MSEIKWLCWQWRTQGALGEVSRSISAQLEQASPNKELGELRRAREPAKNTTQHLRVLQRSLVLEAYQQISSDTHTHHTIGMETKTVLQANLELEREVGGAEKRME